MADKEELVSRAKLAEQAERWVQLCYLQFREDPSEVQWMSG